MKEKIYNIGVVIGNVYTNHPQELIHGICDAAKKLPVNIQFFPGTQSNAFYKNTTDMVLDNDFDYQFNTIYDFALFGNLDAVIISYGTLCIFLRDEEKAEFFQKYANLPQVVLEEPFEEKNASWFISDNYAGICEVMEHLITCHGYRKILHVGGPKDNTDSDQRRQGYLDTMAKYHLPVTEDMIIYGDYSQYMDEEIEVMLCRHPDAEAICCANDDMAVSAYRVCKKLGRMVGVDIAVTGYDNLGIAASMDPPLTTVEQNGYAIGCKALLEAWNLCRGEKTTQNVLPAAFACRESCGCSYGDHAGMIFPGRERLREYLPQFAEHILGEDVLREYSLEVAAKYREQLVQLLSCIFYGMDQQAEAGIGQTELLHDRNLRNILEQIGQEEDSTDIFFRAEVERRIGCLFTDAVTGEENREKRRQIARDFNYVREYFQNRARYQWEERHTDSERKAWLGPLFLRNLLEYGFHEKEALKEAAEGMKRLGIQSSRILLFEEPLILGPTDTWKCPDKLYLAAYHVGDEVAAYEKEERPVITRENGFGQFFQESGHVQVAFSLFNLQKQYGILLCEIGPDAISSTYVISIQLGTALRFLELSRREQQAREKLKETMAEVEKQNRILEFVSNSDPLTGLMNRRGLIERFLEEAQKWEGQKACLIFADLDHLKQINDNYGHAEGDSAIRQISTILRKAGGQDALAARIGGDEFVLVIFGPVEKEKLTAGMKAQCELYNQHSGKPYLVECSVGFVEFVCESGMELAPLFGQADQVMYRAKQHRRKSVIKAKVIPNSSDK